MPDILRVDCNVQEIVAPTLSDGNIEMKIKKAQTEVWAFLEFGAGDESRTRDLNLGKVALYQLSYSRMGTANCCLA